MKLNKLLPCLIVGFAIMTTGLPAQAGMVSTAQIQNSNPSTGLVEIASQRDWITTQLQRGGVEKSRAIERVAAMTDAEITQIYQRIDEVPAGGSDVLLVGIIVFLLLELTGVIDVIPNN